MNNELKNSKNFTVIKKGEKVDLNYGYFTAPSDGTLTIDQNGWRFEKTCGTCEEPCNNGWCVSNED